MTVLRSVARGLRNRQRTPVSLALAFVAALALVAVVAAQSDLETPSPASGTAQVISQGMTARPALRSAWRVVERTIPVRTEARPSDRLEGSAGFLLADGGPIFVIDQDTKQRYRLAPGEAQFIPIGANQTWASLDPRATTAYTIELAVRDNVTEAGEGKVLYKSGSFGMAEGDYDLDLLRDTQPYNEKTRLKATEFPILIFVTQGQLEVDSSKKGVKTIHLRAGQAAALEGDLTLRTRSKSDAVYVAAVVSASIGGGRTSTQPTATPTPTQTPTPEPTATPKPKKTKTPTPELSKSERRTATAEAKRTATVEAKRTATADAKKERTPTPKSGGKKKTPTPEPTKKPTKSATPTPTRVPESRTGSAEVRLEIKLCPAGMRPESLDTSRCRDADGNFSIALQTPYGDTLRLRDANTYNGHYVRWSQLKAGEYQLLVRAFPEGYDASSLDGYLCCTAGGGYSIRLTPGLKVVGTLYFFRPASSAVTSGGSAGARALIAAGNPAAWLAWRWFDTSSSHRPPSDQTANIPVIGDFGRPQPARLPT